MRAPELRPRTRAIVLIKDPHFFGKMACITVPLWGLGYRDWGYTGTFGYCPHPGTVCNRVIQYHSLRNIAIIYIYIYIYILCYSYT